MKLQKVTVAIAVVFGCGALGAKPAVSSNHQVSGKEGVRTKTVAGKAGGWKESYQEIITTLDAKNGGKPVVQACGDAGLADEEKVAELKTHFETIFKYREALNGCKDGLHGKLKSFFDDYIGKMKLENKSSSSLKDAEKPEKTLQGMDSALRFHEHMKKFLSEKEKALKSSSDKFSEADKELVKALDGIFGLCVAKEFKPSDDAETTQKIDEFNNQVKKQGIKEENACELELSDTAPAPVPDTDDNAATISDTDTASDTDTESAAPPVADPSAGTGAATGPGPTAGVQSNVLPISPGVNAPPQGISGLADPALADGLLQQEQAERQQLFDALLRAQQGNRIGGSPDNSRSFQFPPVSVQPNPQQQNPYQQQQQYPQMQQPFPPYPQMQQPMAQSAITPELLAALRGTDNANRPSPAAAAQAAQTQSLMEMARLQQQLMQAQMANQMNNPYLQNGMGPNISRLRRNRTAFRGTRGTAGSRFMSRATRSGRGAR